MTKNKATKFVSEKNVELSEKLNLQNDYANKRHSEKVELVLLRQKFAIELIDVRDKTALKRHSERIEILDKKYNIA